MTGIVLPRRRSVLVEKWADAAFQMPNDLPLLGAIAWAAARDPALVGGVIAYLAHYDEKGWDDIAVRLVADLLREDVAALWCKCGSLPCICCDTAALKIATACAKGEVTMKGRWTNGKGETQPIRPIPANEFSDKSELVWDGSSTRYRRASWDDLLLSRSGLYTIFPARAAGAPVTVRVETECAAWLADVFERERQENTTGLTKAMYFTRMQEKYGAVGPVPRQRIWTKATEAFPERRTAGAKPASNRQG